MKKLRVSRLAERDLDRIWYYVAKRSGTIEAANGAVDSIAERFPFLTKQPSAGRSRDDIEKSLRSFPAGEYVIYYRESGQRVIISRVIHGKQNQQKALTEGG